MKFVFFDDFKPGVVKGDRVVEISDALKGLDASSPQNLLEAVITFYDLLAPRLETMIKNSKGVPIKTVRLRSPVPKPSLFPGGMGNYREGKAPGTYKIRPIFFFLNAPQSIIGPGDTVELPDLPAKVFEHEAEIAFVIKKKTKKVKRKDAMDSVFGYTACIDISARGLGSYSFRHETVSAKSFDTFKPVGPALVTADEVPDPHDLNVKLWVSGELRQDYNTSDMEHPIPEIIEYISSAVTLNPGDLITCGTNHHGLGAIQDGDTVDIEIDRIGRMSVKVVDPLKRKWPKA